jgi:phosphoserine aminotransferase
MVPINLAAGASAPGEDPRSEALYVETGVWAKKAAEEAAKYAAVTTIAGSKDRAYTYIPALPPIGDNAAYCHITLNNTIVGTRWSSIPEIGNIPLVSDISSCILSEYLDVSKFGVLYAGAQKNLGPAGTTVVIIREDLIGRAPAWTPALLRYDIHAAEGSLYNTPPCYGIYVVGLVLEWLRDMGGIPAVEKLNREKAGLLYSYLDRSGLFRSPVEKPFRSLMNIPFVTTVDDAEKRAALEKRFVTEAAAEGLVNLAGHRLVGGMRASVYNAMPMEGVRALIAFMKKFEEKAR